MIVDWSIPNASVHLQSYGCRASAVSTLATAFLITRAIIVVPFAIWVLYLGYKRWRKQQEQQRSVKIMSHCDIITYHMALMQLTEAPGLVFYLMGYVAESLTVVGFSVSSLTILGEILFHVLTCVERYLAVIHPIAYLKYKYTNGVIMRNTCVGAVWLFSLGWGGLVFMQYPVIPFLQLFCVSSLSFIIVSFCSLSVLCALVRPRPGEAGGDRVDQSKRKAFKTLITITASLWLLFLGYFVSYSLKASSFLKYSDWCLVATGILWFSLPSSLVVPLLFLFRAKRQTNTLYK